MTAGRPGRPYPSHSTPNANGQRQGTNSSHLHASDSSDSKIIDVVEVTSAAPTNQQTEPEDIIHAISDESESDTIEWQSGDELGRAADDHEHQRRQCPTGNVFTSESHTHTLCTPFSQLHPPYTHCLPSLLSSQPN